MRLIVLQLGYAGACRTLVSDVQSVSEQQSHRSTKPRSGKSGNALMIQAPRVRLLDQSLRKVAMMSLHCTDKENGEVSCRTTTGGEVCRKDSSCPGHDVLCGSGHIPVVDLQLITPNLLGAFFASFHPCSTTPSIHSRTVQDSRSTSSTCHSSDLAFPRSLSRLPGSFSSFSRTSGHAALVITFSRPNSLPPSSHVSCAIC